MASKRGKRCIRWESLATSDLRLAFCFSKECVQRGKHSCVVFKFNLDHRTGVIVSGLATNEFFEAPFLSAQMRDLVCEADDPQAALVSRREKRFVLVQVFHMRRASPGCDGCATNEYRRGLKTS